MRPVRVPSFRDEAGMMLQLRERRLSAETTDLDRDGCRKRFLGDAQIALAGRLQAT